MRTAVIITTGTAGEARRWAQKSSLGWNEKRPLFSLLDRFPGLTFYRMHRPDTDPAWLRELGEVLLGVYSVEGVFEYRFSYFDFEEEAQDAFQSCFYFVHGALDMDYEGAGVFSFAPELGEFQEITVDGIPLLIVARIFETCESVLAVKGGESTDTGVYDFSYGDIESDAEGSGKGRLSRDKLRLAFPSYYEMLGWVNAVRFSWGMVVEAVIWE